MLLLQIVFTSNINEIHLFTISDCNNKHINSFLKTSVKGLESYFNLKLYNKEQLNTKSTKYLQTGREKR